MLGSKLTHSCHVEYTRLVSFQWGPQSVSIQAGGGNVFGQLLEGLFRPMQQPENQERVADAANNFFGQMLDGLMGGLRQGAAAGGGAAGGVGGAGAAAAAGFNLDSLFNLRNLNIGNFNRECACSCSPF